MHAVPDDDSESSTGRKRRRKKADFDIVELPTMIWSSIKTLHAKARRNRRHNGE
jgi:hypothetical protein